MQISVVQGMFLIAFPLPSLPFHKANDAIRTRRKCISEKIISTSLPLVHSICFRRIKFSIQFRYRFGRSSHVPEGSVRGGETRCGWFQHRMLVKFYSEAFTRALLQIFMDGWYLQWRHVTLLVYGCAKKAFKFSLIQGLFAPFAMLTLPLTFFH